MYSVEKLYDMCRIRRRVPLCPPLGQLEALKMLLAMGQWMGRIRLMTSLMMTCPTLAGILTWRLKLVLIKALLML